MKHLIIILVLVAAATAQTGKHRVIYSGVTPPAPRQVASNGHNFGDGVTTVAATFPGNVVSGNTLITSCTYWAFGAPAVATVTDSQGNVWTQRGTTPLTTGGFLGRDAEQWVFTATAGSSAADTVTCHMGSDAITDIMTLEYTPLIHDITNCQSTSSGSPATITHAPTTSAVDILVLMSNIDTTAPSDPTGFTNRISNTSTINYFTWDRGNVAAGVQSVTVTGTGTAEFHSCLMALHP